MSWSWYGRAVGLCRGIARETWVGRRALRTSVASEPEELLTATADDSASERTAASALARMLGEGSMAGIAPVARACRWAK
jgi:hypothetical protein